MSDARPPRVEDEGPAAPPRDNGTLVFAEPWESQAFAMEVALEEAGLVDPAEFRVRLVEEIARWEAAPAATRGGWRYYARWLDALESVVVHRGLVDERELDARIAELRRRDDHGHPHDAAHIEH